MPARTSDDFRREKIEALRLFGLAKGWDSDTVTRLVASDPHIAAKSKLAAVASMAPPVAQMPAAPMPMPYPQDMAPLEETMSNYEGEAVPVFRRPAMPRKR